MTTVTVIIPAYNAEATLERALLSVLAQTHRDLEVFVVDDGSTDRTAGLARALAARDGRVRLLGQPNAGVAAARNLALRQATGEFVCWLDADDLWAPTKVERQLATYQSAWPPPAFVYSGYRLIDMDDRIIANFRTLTDVSGRTLCRQIATNFFSNVSSIMVPRANALRFGGHDVRLRQWGIEGAEDLLLQLQLSTVGPAACCREALVGYRMHGRNMSRSHSRAARSNLRVIDMIGEAEPRLPDWVLRLGRARTAGYILHLLREGDVRAAARLFAHLMRGQPGYTLLTLWLILAWQVVSATGSGASADPAVGQPFLGADPTSAPWSGHMILTEAHRRALDEADRELLAAGCEAVELGATG